MILWKHYVRYMMKIKNLKEFKNYLVVNFDRKKTIITYYNELKSFFNKYDRFTQKTVFEYIKFKRENQTLSSVNSFISAGKQFAKFKQLNIEFPKYKKSEPKIPNYLSEQQLFEILDKLPALTNDYLKWKVILLTMFYTTIRSQELINLTRADIDLEKLLITVRKVKNRTPKILPIPKGVGQIIKVYFATEPETKNAFNTKNLSYMFKTIKQGFNLDEFHPHLLRHSGIRYLLDKGIPLNKVQAITGHKKLTSLEIYTKIKNEELNDLYKKQIKTEIDKRK